MQSLLTTNMIKFKHTVSVEKLQIRLLSHLAEIANGLEGLLNINKQSKKEI